MKRLYEHDKTIADELLYQSSNFQLYSDDSAPRAILTPQDYHLRILIMASLFVHACLKHAESTTARILHKRDSEFGTLSYASWLQPFIIQSDFDELIAARASSFQKFDTCVEIQCFFRVKDSANLDLFELKNYARSHQHWDIRKLQSCINNLNQFIDLIRADMKRPVNQAAIQARLRKSQANFKSCCQLIKGLFEKYSKINVLRLDFALKPEPNVLSGSKLINLEHTFHSVHNLEYMKSKIAQLLRNKRHNHILDQVIGYILKFEHGHRKGFHVHALFFLDGNKHNKDGYFASEIAKYWLKLTENRGCTYNCNFDKGKYSQVAIGMIDYADTEKRMLLMEKCVRYLCKCDQFFIFKPLAQFRTMQLSQRPKVRSPLGRPRKHAA